MSFCYLGDTLDGDGQADLAVTARIRNGWMNFREHLPFLTSRTPPLEMKGREFDRYMIELEIDRKKWGRNVRKRKSNPIKKRSINQ